MGRCFGIDDRPEAAWVEEEEQVQDFEGTRALVTGGGTGLVLPLQAGCRRAVRR